MPTTLADLVRATERFAAEVAHSDPDAPVPTCPGWTVARLVHHLGDVHAWAADAVHRAGEPPGPADGPAPGGDLADWYAARAAALVAELTGTEAAAPAWVFGPVAGTGTAAFWVRRQVHETLLHTVDLVGPRAAVELDPALAWDGVEEVRDVFYPRQVALGRSPALPLALELVATDLDRPPVVLGAGAPVRVAGPAVELLLRVWHRVDVGPDGEDERAAALLAMPLTP